jgi:hypothetical protein
VQVFRHAVGLLFRLSSLLSRPLEVHEARRRGGGKVESVLCFPKQHRAGMLRTAPEKTSERISRNALLCCLTSIVMLLLILRAFAADKQKDEDTLRKANLLLQDMLNSKDISPTVLSKADCVLNLPGVKKFGFGVGGSGGRGPLLSRSGKTSTASAPRLRCLRSAAPALVCR